MTILSISSWARLRNQRFATAALSLLVFFAVAPNPAQAGITADVQEILIGVLDQRTGGVTDSFSFDVELFGSNITTITLLTPPSPQFAGGETLTQNDFEQDGDDWCLEVDFPNLAALQNRFVTGDYTFTINGNQVVLNYNPAVPDGAISVSFPAHLGNMPNGQPTFTSTTTCTNCNIVEGLVENGLGTIEIETPTALSPSPLPSSFQFADFGPNQVGPPISSLPLGTYGFCVLSSVVVLSTEMLGGSDSFQYVAERGNDDLVGFTVTTPQLTSDVDEAIIEYLEAEGDWIFGATIEGAGISSGTVIPPNQAPIPLVLDSPGEYQFESALFVSEAAVRAAHPPTSGVDKYVLVVDGGERFYSADFDPGSPNGGVMLVSPLDGATVGSMPSFTISNACTNCTSQFIAILSVADDGVDTQVFSPNFPYPTVVNFGDFGPNQGTLGNPLTELPLGEYEVELDTTVETVADVSFTPPDSFLYFSATFREDPSTFIVPEPGALLCQLFAGMTLVGLRRARRRSR